MSVVSRHRDQDDPATIDASVGAAPALAADARAAPSVGPSLDLAEAIQRYWLVFNDVNATTERATFWHFSDSSRFELFEMEMSGGGTPSLERSPGRYSIDGRTLSLWYYYVHYRLDVATRIIDDHPALLMRVYTPLGKAHWRTEFLRETTREDGSWWRRELVESELVFDAPIPATGEGDCEVQIVFRVEHYSVVSPAGVELPEDERTNVDAGDEVVSCSYAPSERGQEIRFGEGFATATFPPALNPVLRGSLTFHPDEPGVLFMSVAFGHDELPASPFGP